ncbi:beta-1,6-N-acetylglucosaminyltransferase [Modestobacter sp. SYSU DS0657]
MSGQVVVEPGSARREPRVAYFVSSYREEAQLRRLLHTLRAAQPDAPLLVFHNVFASDIDPAVVAEVGGHLFTSTEPIVWGDMSLDRARLQVLRWAAEHVDFDWLVLLSEQDYPIAPLDALGRRLAGSGADVVLDAQPVDEIADPGLRRECDLRYRYQRVALPAVPFDGMLRGSARDALALARRGAYRALELAQRQAHVYQFPPGMELPSKLGLRTGGPRGVPEDWRLWFGSAWYAISHGGTQRLLELVDEHPEVVRHFERTVIPSEAMVHSLLANAPDVRVERDSLHHIRWTDDGSGRPDVFTEADLPELLASGRFFARKFDLAQGTVLDQLDRLVLGTPAGVRPTVAA